MSPTRQRSLVAGLIVMGILIAGFFGLRAFHAFREFRRHGAPPRLAEALVEPPMETDVELIRDWMTVPYIALTYHVHPKVLFDTLGINPRDNDEKSLAQLNGEFFPGKPGFVVDLIKAAVQANQPPPTVIVPNAPTLPSARTTP